jgi:hypothetical protein
LLVLPLEVVEMAPGAIPGEPNLDVRDGIAPVG